MTTGNDVLIVGSGPVGTAIARRLAESGLEVTVLESGTAITDPPGSHLRNQPRFQQNPDTFFSGVEPYLQSPNESPTSSDLPGASDSSLVGGQGILWTNNCPRMAGFERWEAMAPMEWERWYSEAEDMLQVVSDPTAASRTGQGVCDSLRSALADQGRIIRGLPLSGRLLPEGRIHFNAPWDIHAAASQEVQDRITIRSGLRVTRLRYHGSRVMGVEVTGPGDDREVLEAGTIVVAGGAIATPRLLHRSGIRPQALGEGISFHTVLFGQVVLAADLCPPASESDIAPRLWVPPTPAPLGTSRS